MTSDKIYKNHAVQTKTAVNQTQRSAVNLLCLFCSQNVATRSGTMVRATSGTLKVSATESSDLG